MLHTVAAIAVILMVGHYFWQQYRQRSSRQENLSTNYGGVEASNGSSRFRISRRALALTIAVVVVGGAAGITTAALSASSSSSPAKGMRDPFDPPDNYKSGSKKGGKESKRQKPHKATRSSQASSTTSSASRHLATTSSRATSRSQDPCVRGNCPPRANDYSPHRGERANCAQPRRCQDDQNPQHPSRCKTGSNPNGNGRCKKSKYVGEA